jgi:Glycerophosphoryl diester phosphodiesterase family/HEAT repeats
MRDVLVLLLALSVASSAHAGSVQLLCHRTANEDVPENTLESLDQAALLGCNVVEIDLRRTLDGEIVLNHDGILERLTDGVGEIGTTYYRDLQSRDLGSWMGERFADLHIALFADALRLARKRDIRLVLDMKEKGLGPDVLQMLQSEGMLQRVQFNGEWDDLKKLYPAATDVANGTVWVQPGVSEDQVKAYHRQGKLVVANFSANGHDMDLAGMKAAVATGVDGINVDYPRLGADAVGRPVEQRLHELILQADSGESGARVAAILELCRYSGFPLQANFARWLLDANDHVSRAAAVALVTARPRAPVSAFTQAFQSGNADARANAAWALGVLHAPASALLPLLQDKDPLVLQAALLALGRSPGEVRASALLPLLSHLDSGVRGAAAVALARHQPETAIKAVPLQLQREMVAEGAIHDDYVKRGKPQFTQPQIDVIMRSFKCQMEMVRAIAMVKGNQATTELAALAFRPDESFSSYDGIVAGFQLWDRIGADAAAAVHALGSSDPQVANRAEWILVKAGPAILPDVRKALASDNKDVSERAICIVAWQGDTGSLAMLDTMKKAGTPEALLAAWAIDKIESLHPKS